MTLLKRYRFFIITLVILGILLLMDYTLGMKAINTTAYQFKVMLLVIPPIFILLGLLDVWIPRETMIKYMGENSGIKGILLAFLLGSAAAGPLYGAFPIAAVFMKKGVKFSNIIIFIGAWSTTKIPMFLFEVAALGQKFALTRLAINIPGIIIIAFLISKIITDQEKKEIYDKAQDL